jgi:hypothetical protein
MSVQITVTTTGLIKGYFDAIKSLQKLLKDSEILDFDNIEIEKKHLVPVKLLPSGLKIELSMYRPKTKDGAFRRIGLSRKFSYGLGLSAGDSIEFTMVGSELCVRKVVSEDDDSSSLSGQELDSLSLGGTDALEEALGEQVSNSFAIDLRNAKENDFLNQLLWLHQDGKEAISHPRSWASPPLLEVDTKQVRKVSEIVEAIKRANTGTGIWFSWTGSPGEAILTSLHAKH